MIHVGIMGLGRSGWNIHASTLKNLPEFKVVAVADPEPSRRQEAVDALGCRAYGAPEELLQDGGVEVVVVATPTYTHVEYGRRALEAGKHVIIEKPMAQSAREVDDLIAVAEKAGRRLTGFQNRRYDPDYLKVQEVIRSGSLGPLHLVKLSRHGFQRRNDWQTLLKFGGGQLGNWGAHVLDHALLILGGDPVDLFSDLQTTVSAGDAEDHVKVVLRGETGLVVDVEITSGCAFPQPEWLLMGKYGGLVSSGRRLEWKYYDPDALPPLEAIEGPAPNRAYGSGETIPWQSQSAEIPRDNSNVSWYQDFYRAISRGEAPPVTPQSIRRLIALMEAVRGASQIGQLSG